MRTPPYSYVRIYNVKYGAVSIDQLLYHNIYNLTGHYDDFAYRLAVNPLGGSFVAEGHFLHLFTRKLGAHFKIGRAHV